MNSYSLEIDFERGLMTASVEISLAGSYNDNNEGLTTNILKTYLTFKS